MVVNRDANVEFGYELIETCEGIFARVGGKIANAGLFSKFKELAIRRVIFAEQVYAVREELYVRRGALLLHRFDLLVACRRIEMSSKELHTADAERLHLCERIIKG